MQQAGYREGITAGKEGALQAGFDEGYKDFGRLGGLELGRARGLANTLLNFLKSSQPDLAQEAQDIVKGLGQLSMEDVCPKDQEAEKHFRDHEGYERHENLTDKLDSAFSGTLGLKEKPEFALLRQRLDVLAAQILPS